MSPVLERSGATSGGARPEPRSLDKIFASLNDAARGRELQGTWVAFCREMDGPVRTALAGGGSPPEIAYAVGEIVHNYFRTRGATLTSYELRRLVAELLDQRAPTPDQDDKAATSTAAAAALVAFASDPAKRETPWTGEAATQPTPTVPDAVFKGPPSPLVSLTGREAAAFERLLARVLGLARPRLGTTSGRRIARDEALRAIEAAIDEVARGDDDAPRTDRRERLAAAALSEICGLGPIDRLWVDRSIDAIFINGPQDVYVERDGLLERSPEGFADHAHLLDVVSRLVSRGDSAVADFRLRDGGGGTVVFPPAAPDGPVVAIRRGAPGMATFERLIAQDVLDRPIADLLRIAVRCRLNVLVTGPPRSGKTALLAAMARDPGDTMRIVTLARHREFRTPAPGKIELVASTSRDADYSVLVAAGARLRPYLLILDSIARAEVASLVERLSQGGRGMVAAVPAEAMTVSLARSVDIVLRLGRGHDGLFRAVSLEDATGAAIFAYDNGRFHRRTVAPAFAEIVRAAGCGEALASVLR